MQDEVDQEGRGVESALGHARSRWEELARVAPHEPDRLSEMIGRLTKDELRIMVFEQIMRPDKRFSRM